MAVYGVALLLVVFWPVPVDSGASARRLVQWLLAVVPLLTYDVLEFLSNVAMFVPFGAGLAVLVRRRWTVLPLALLFASSVEFAQAVLLPARTASALDVLANTAGAALGIAVVVLWQRTRGRRG